MQVLHLLRLCWLARAIAHLSCCLSYLICHAARYAGLLQ